MESKSGWSPESMEIYKSLLQRRDAGEFELLTRSDELMERKRKQGRHLFPASSLDDPRTMYNMILFYDDKGKRASGLCQFGKYAQGPIGHAHGGAIATMADIITSHVCSQQLVMCMTKYLTINYRRATPLHSAVLLEVWCVKTEGRKVGLWIDFKMMNAKDKTVYADGESMWVQLKGNL